jgi:hypothetical protein
MLSPVKLWVLAMLAPSGAARGSGPAAEEAANLTGLARDCPGKVQVGTKEQAH